MSLIETMRRALQSREARKQSEQCWPRWAPKTSTSGEGDNGVLNRFELSVLTEGSGTQMFSTTFVQWSGVKLYDEHSR